MTGKARFERDVIELIERENRRRKIGKGYILRHVVQVVNRMAHVEGMRFVQEKDEEVVT